jgi:hypothetical protein
MLHCTTSLWEWQPLGGKSQSRHLQIAPGVENRARESQDFERHE